VTDKNPWGTHFNLDQPAFQDTLAWYFGLVRKGYMPTYAETGGANAIGTDKQIQSGIAAMGLSGSWMISTFSNLTDAAGKKLEIGIAPPPIGPTAKRASVFNGLADSVTLFPVTADAADIVALMNPHMDAVYIGSAPVSSLTKLNKQLSDLFEVTE
jgi:multiple sugar transport system substrate-binding protein